ncbi:hypothetical protein J4230_00285 [Candidatus Woesearchaeota archaeon]|nr:hypothetical protein [Candidatus Woesearchaeota archaeon]
MKEIIKKIKSKKTLDRLDDTFVESFLNIFLKKNSKLNKKYLDGELKKKDIRIIVKSVRNNLNRFYGQFWTSDKLKLESHRSTKERLGIYDKLYSFIFSITCRPKTILDLACGLNPLTYKNIGNDIYFIAVELTEYDCGKIKEYFERENIKGEVIRADLRTYNTFPSADLCFMFKILDSLGGNNNLIAENLIRSVKAKYIVASFSTKNVKGKKMNYPKRGWFEIMLRRIGYRFVKFDTNNEVFYIIKKL